MRKRGTDEDPIQGQEAHDRGKRSRAERGRDERRTHERRARHRQRPEGRAQISPASDGANGATRPNGSAVKTKPQAKPATKGSNGNGHKPTAAGAVSAGADPLADGHGFLSKPRTFLARHRVVSILAGTVVALGIGFAIAFVVLGVLDKSEEQVRDSLSNANTTLDDSVSGVEDAANSDRPLTDLESLAAGADDSASEIEQAEADLSGAVDDGRIVNPALEVMALEQEFLAEFSAIASFPEKELAQRWDNLEPKLVRIQRDINAAGGSVEALGLGGESPLFPESKELTAVIDSADGILIEADRVLSKWRDELAQAKQQGRMRSSSPPATSRRSRRCSRTTRTRAPRPPS